MIHISVKPMPIKTEVLFKKRSSRGKWVLSWPLHIMLLPALILVFIFNYIPMAGIVMAFQDFQPWLGIAHSDWVGWLHFQDMFQQPDSKQVIINTLIISLLQLFSLVIFSVLFAILVNEIRLMGYKRMIQTLVYLPHFLSWVILGGILADLLSVEGGLINQILQQLGMRPVFFLGQGDWFRFTVIISNLWKEFGFSAIIFLASLAGINPSLYEAAEMDGANRWKQTLHITLPALVPMMIVVTTLALGSILSNGFDQIFNLYNPLVYDKGDIIDTYVYRLALIQGLYGFATAVGIFKSFVGMILIIGAYWSAYKFANYKVF